MVKQKIIESLGIIKEDETIEVRIPSTKCGTISGYFNDGYKLAEEIEPYNGKYDIDITLNPVKSELLARRENRLENYVKQTTSDDDIKILEYLCVDIDAVRASGISATDEELEKTKEKAYKIKRFLEDEYEISNAVIINSGNGYYLLYYLWFDNTKKNREIIKRLLQALDFLFSDNEVKIDTTYNANRTIRLPGTKACQGDNTKERPHRDSFIEEIPDELSQIDESKLLEIIELMPKEDEISKKLDKGFDLESWFEKNDLEVLHKADFHNKGTKYTLKECPWNKEHENSSAYIIKFNSGAIVSGCNHDNCKDKGWKELKGLFKNDSEDNLDNAGGKKSLPDILVELASQKARFFCNEIEEGFAAIEVDNHIEVIKLRSKKFNRWLIKLYFILTGKSASQDAIKQAINTLEMFASFSGDEKKLEKRVAVDGDNFYYDLADAHWRAIKINKYGVALEDNPPILFTRGANMKKQEKPDLDVEAKELIGYIDKHFRFKTESDKVLFMSYLVSCFVAEIPHPILLLYGEKGAAKSTTMRMIKSIVDPAKEELFSIPTSNTDLALSLANNYMPIYDNIETISSEKSNMLCMAATGGSFSKRTLYTDEDESIVSFKRCVGFNGINIGATKSDLLDRCLLNELERIDETERKTEKEVWSNFEEDKPKILGACLKALSKAMEIYPTVKLDRLGRMADFTIWGYAIAEAVGIEGEKFLEAYLKNQDKTNEEAISSHPVASSLIALMKDKSKWTGSVSKLLAQLELVATEEKINIKSNAFPKASHALSKRLKEVKSNLEKVGIYFKIRHAGAYKEITVENENLENGENDVNMVEREKVRKEEAKKNQIEAEVQINNFVRPNENN